MIVRRASRKDGKSRYGVKHGPNEKEIKTEFFETEAEREKFYKAMKKKAREEGSAILHLSAPDAVLLKRALDSVGGDAVNVLKAVELWNERSALKAVPVADAARMFLDEKYNLGRDDNWMGHHRKYLSRFQAFAGAVSVCDVSTEQAQAWIFQMNFAPVTLNHHAKTLRTFFNWCKDRNFCRENPFEKVNTPDIVRGEPEFLTVEQTRAIFRAALNHYPDALAYLAMQAFAGIRASACSRVALDGGIKFEDRLFVITARNAKNNARDVVEHHPDNLWTWLEFAKKRAPDGFALSERMHRRRSEQIAEKAGFRPPKNAFRHSFASYYAAFSGDAGKTATLLTHRGNSFLLYKHYKGNATRAEAEKYFSILPENVLNDEIHPS
jgi:site-specific recombinase XerD